METPILKKVEFNFECPFLYTEVYRMSEYTAGSDTKCTLLDAADCDGVGQKKCPLTEHSFLIVRHKGS